MYAKNNNYVTYFAGNTAQNTEKLFCGRVSEAVKTGKIENGRPKYEFEQWNARFVGKARKKAEELTDGARLTLTEWSVHNPYNKEKKRSYPYIMVMDFEIREQKNRTEEEPEMPVGGGFAPIDDEDGELPF